MGLRIDVRSEPETTSLAIRRTFLSHRCAHAYSVARIASPTGITTNAGPGRISKAIPISTTVAPITDTITRLTILMLSSFQRLNKRLIEDHMISSASECASELSSNRYARSVRIRVSNGKSGAQTIEKSNLPGF